jgi:hypothetical protein
VLEDFRIFSRPYPSDTELRKAFIRMNSWTDYKKNLVDNILKERANRKWYTS